MRRRIDLTCECIQIRHSSCSSWNNNPWLIGIGLSVNNVGGSRREIRPVSLRSLWMLCNSLVSRISRIPRIRIIVRCRAGLWLAAAVIVIVAEFVSHDNNTNKVLKGVVRQSTMCVWCKLHRYTLICLRKTQRNSWRGTTLQCFLLAFIELSCQSIYCERYLIYSQR
jgi:hypothetical protein